MFFIDIESENLIQVGDRLRISAQRSSGTNDHSPVAKVEIQPEATESFIEVSDSAIPLDYSKWFLDWEYETDGTKTVTVKFTFEDLTTKEKTFAIECITAVEDSLFSGDDDLKIHESDILKYLMLGKTSFKNVHRRAQALILNELDRKGFRLQNGDKITKSEILDKSEVKEWSNFLTLKLIFESVSNAKDDIFRIKALAYGKAEKDEIGRAHV